MLVFLGELLWALGNISDPNKDYHLDISFKELENAEILCDLGLLFDINFKIMQRKKEYVIYLKDSEQIASFLTLIGACSAVLRLEEIKVVKDVRNNVNRLVNCETANLNKTINASVKVINDIEYLKKEGLYNSLPETLKEIAEIRINNPNTSIKELGEMMLPPLSKSGVSHRLNKLSKLADDYRKRG